MFFVHGLGGHAFRTWSTDDAGFPRMWPRDFLPSSIASNGLAGRFSTIGYSAKALNTYSATTTIQRAAENLLMQIRVDRPEVGSLPLEGHGAKICSIIMHADHPNSRVLTVPYISLATVSEVL